MRSPFIACLALAAALLLTASPGPTRADEPAARPADEFAQLYGLWVVDFQAMEQREDTAAWLQTLTGAMTRGMAYFLTLEFGPNGGRGISGHDEWWPLERRADGLFEMPRPDRAIPESTTIEMLRADQLLLRSDRDGDILLLLKRLTDLDPADEPRARTLFSSLDGLWIVDWDLTRASDSYRGASDWARDRWRQLLDTSASIRIDAPSEMVHYWDGKEHSVNPPFGLVPRGLTEAGDLVVMAMGQNRCAHVVRIEQPDIIWVGDGKRYEFALRRSRE